MADDDNSQDKTEEPTAKREEDARKKGDIARSKELNTVVVLMMGSTMLWMNGDRIVKGMATVMSDSFSINRDIMYDPMQMVFRLEGAMQDALMFVAPFLGVMVIAALAGPLAMGGWERV